MKRKEIAKKFIKESGISFAKFAKEIGLSPQNWHHHFKKDDIDLDLFQKISDKLKEKGINIDDAVVYPDNKNKSLVNENLVAYLANKVMELEKENEDLKEKLKHSIPEISLLNKTTSSKKIKG